MPGTGTLSEVGPIVLSPVATAPAATSQPPVGIVATPTITGAPSTPTSSGRAVIGPRTTSPQMRVSMAPRTRPQTVGIGTVRPLAQQPVTTPRPVPMATVPPTVGARAVIAPAGQITQIRQTAQTPGPAGAGDGQTVVAPATPAPRTVIGPSTQTTVTPIPVPVTRPAAVPTAATPPAYRAAVPTVAPSAALALSQGTAKTFTPGSAAAVAVENSIDLQITAANVREAEAQLRQTFGLDDFQLTASATYGRRGPVATAGFPGANGQVTEVKLGDPDIRQQSLELVKPLYTNGRIERAQTVAMRALETRKLSKAVVERALDLAARQTVYQILLAQQLAAVTEQRTEAVAAHLDQTKKLRDVGIVAQFEVVQAETELANAQGAVISARTGVEQAIAALRRLLTLSQDEPIGVIDGEPPVVPPGTRTDLVERAWKDRPEIRMTQAGIALAKANLRLAFASRNVSVSLVGGLNHAGESFGSEPWSWQIAIAAQKPILDAKLEKTEVQKAKAQVDAANLELEKQKQEIALEVTQAALALDDAVERLKVAQQGVVEAQERLRIARVRYQNGLALGVEVLDAQTALAAAQAERANSQYSLYSSVAQLRSAVGLWTGNEQ